MIFIFEDHEEDIISKFFKKAYSDNIANSFIYAKGNGNIKNIAKQTLTMTNDTVVVFFDTIPGNKETWKIYKTLRDMSIQVNYRMIVLPLVCMEYYLIKALKNSQVIIDNTGIDICINKDLYFNSPLISTADDKTMVKNFEKYCKLILIKNLKACACHSGKTTVQCYGAYYINDCLCEFKDNECCQEKLCSKLKNYLSQFDYVPENSITGNSKILSTEEVWDIHRKLVQEYNEMVNYYIHSGNVAVDKSQYKEIRAIK